jgi:perosamine synthetase
MALTSLPAEMLVTRSARVRQALTQLDSIGLGFLIVVDDVGALAGVLTDGDIRRALLREGTLDDPVEVAMHADCVSLPATASAAEINDALTDRISFLPLVDENGRPVDYASRDRHRRFPVAEPLLDGNEEAYVVECVRTGWISSQGHFVGRFERAVAEFHDAAYAVAVSNGTAALHLALLSLGVGPGDEVIVPDFTFAATASAVLHAGAVPVFVDVDPETWTMDPEAAARAVTGRTRAILPVHVYGHPCDMAALTELAAERGLVVVEDVAEAFGARADSRLAGTFGDAACFSFFGNKTLTTGEGGMVLLRDEKAFERARVLRDHGMAPDRRYWHVEAGHNYRLTNLQAAVGVAQMERVDDVLTRKRALAARYDETLADVPGIRLPARAPWAEPVCWLYTVGVTDELGLTRDELAERLLLTGTETRPVFYPLHEMPPFRPFARAGSFPVTEAIAASGLSLPSAVTLTADDVDTVAKAVRSIVEVRQMSTASGPAA